MIIAPSIIQPSSLFKVVVTINDLTDAPRLGTLLNHKPFVDVRLALFRNGADIQGSNKPISPGSSDVLQILVTFMLISIIILYNTIRCTTLYNTHL